MTLNEIIVSALGQLGRGHDSQTMDEWRDSFKLYANDAAGEIAKAIGLHRSENVQVVDGAVDLTQLQRQYIKVLSVEKDGGSIGFSTGRKTGELKVSAAGEVTVDYRHMPLDMDGATDQPEVPAHTHALIVLYVVARERASQDAGVQGGSRVYFEMWNAGLSALRKSAGEPDQYEIVNKW